WSVTQGKNCSSSRSSISVRTEQAIEFRYANCTKACVSSMSSKHRRKDGAYLPVHTYFSAVGGRAPNQQTFLTVTVDITARRAAEDALRAAQSELARVARANGNAGLRWLDRAVPNLEEANAAFERVVNEAHRAAHIITGIRSMFRKDSGE